MWPGFLERWYTLINYFIYFKQYLLRGARPVQRGCFEAALMKKKKNNTQDNFFFKALLGAPLANTI